MDFDLPAFDFGFKLGEDRRTSHANLNGPLSCLWLLGVRASNFSVLESLDQRQVLRVEKMQTDGRQSVKLRSHFEIFKRSTKEIRNRLETKLAHSAQAESAFN